MIKVVFNSRTIYKASYLLLAVMVLNLTAKAQVVRSSTEQWNRHIADSLLDRLKSAAEDTNKVKLLNGIAFRMNRVRDLDDALQYGQQALSLARKLQYREGEMIAYRHLADAHTQDGKYQPALDYYF